MAATVVIAAFLISISVRCAAFLGAPIGRSVRVLLDTVLGFASGRTQSRGRLKRENSLYSWLEFIAKFKLSRGESPTRIEPAWINIGILLLLAQPPLTILVRYLAPGFAYGADVRRSRPVGSGRRMRAGIVPCVADEREATRHGPACGARHGRCPAHRPRHRAGARV